MDMSSPSPRLPTFFLSIGGPNFLENPTHPAASRLAAVGKDITTIIKPKAILVISAHWSSDRQNEVQINVAEDAGLIYDFNGFPDWYYKVEYPYRGSADVAERVARQLEGKGAKIGRVQRGLDHGVWIGFLSAFDPKTNPLDVPIVQLSLYADQGLERHYRLGEALQGLRDEGVLIIGAGMAVHNLSDFRRNLGRKDWTMPYTSAFDDALKEAVSSRPSDRKDEMLALMKRSDGREAHPTLEHLLPMYIAAGAAGVDVGKRLWTYAEGSLNWAQYRFGA